MKRSVAKFLCISAILVMAPVRGLHAQAVGTITGIVTDPSGAVIPGARITAQTGAPFTVVGPYGTLAYGFDSFNGVGTRPFLLQEATRSPNLTPGTGPQFFSNQVIGLGQGPRGSSLAGMGTGPLSVPSQRFMGGADMPKNGTSAPPRGMTYGPSLISQLLYAGSKSARVRLSFVPPDDSRPCNVFRYASLFH